MEALYTACYRRVLPEGADLHVFGPAQDFRVRAWDERA